MPHSEDMNGGSTVVDMIDNAIGAKNNLPDGLIRLFRDGAIRERQTGCEFDAAKNAIREMGSGSRIIPGDESDNLPEVLDSRLRPD